MPQEDVVSKLKAAAGSGSIHEPPPPLTMQHAEPQALAVDVVILEDFTDEHAPVLGPRCQHEAKLALPGRVTQRDPEVGFGDVPDSSPPAVVGKDELYLFPLVRVLPVQEDIVSRNGGTGEGDRSVGKTCLRDLCTWEGARKQEAQVDTEIITFGLHRNCIRLNYVDSLTVGIVVEVSCPATCKTKIEDRKVITMDWK